MQTDTITDGNNEKSFLSNKFDLLVPLPSPPLSQSNSEINLIYYCLHKWMAPSCLVAELVFLPSSVHVCVYIKASCPGG